MLSSLLLSLGLLVGTSQPAPPSSVASTSAPAILLTPQFRRYGTANGLPSSSVYVAVQDREGAMWFGTKGGIARFDGLAFRVFRHVAGDPDSLINNGISALLVDQKGHLWAGGLEAGLNRYDPMHDRFEHWGHSAGDPDSLASDKVWAIAQTSDDVLWVGTARGLDRMKPDGSGFAHVANPLLGDKPDAFGMIATLYVDARDRLWIGSNLGVFRRDPDGSFHAIHRTDSDHPIDAWRIEGDGDEVRVSAVRGLFFVGPDDIARPYAMDKIANVNVLSSVRDLNGRLWVGTQRGLFLQNGGTGQPMTAIVDQPLLPGNLPGTWVFNIIMDREGGMWITLFDGGIAYLAPGWSRISRFSHIPEDPSSLRDSEATAVARSRDGKIWVGGRASVIDKLDPVTGIAEHVLGGKRGDVVGITEDAQGRLWVVTQGAIYRYVDGKLDEVKPDPEGMQHPLEVEVGPDGKLYARSFGEGVYRIDQDTLQVTPVPIRPADEKARWGAQLTLRNGVFWYASDGGLLRLNSTHEYFESVPGVTNDRVVDAFDFTDDGLWLARPDGLERYSYAKDGLTLVQRVDAAHGWPSIGVYDLAVDAQQRVWIFGRDGLWRFDPADDQFRRIGLQDGLINGEFARGFARMPNGYIYAPTLGGVVAFNPNLPDVSPYEPPLAITGLHILRHGVQTDLPLRGDIINVGWEDRGLTVTARVFSYVDTASNHYRFRLTDFDNNWVDTGNVGVREFAGLGAGDYTLEVMGAGADGQWSSLRQPLKIHVDAPPWVRWWAWCAYSLFAALLVWLVLLIWQRRLSNRHRIQLAEQRRHLAEQASAAKTQFLATLSHEIRTPMTGVIGMSELLMNTPLSPSQREYTEAMQRSGSLLLKLVNDALDLARIEAGRLELDMAPFDPRALVDDIARLERNQAKKKGLRFEVSCADDLPRYVLGDAMRIKQVLLNLANNALKFTERGEVLLRAERGSEGIMFSITDTGPGISEAGQARLFQRFEQENGPQRNSGSGLGLAICRELVGLMGGSVELESKLGHGSTFRVRLPLREVEPEIPVVVTPVAVTQQRPLNVLLIEDDAIAAAVIRGLLEQQGHHVRYVNNGLAAMAELAQGGCDVVLLDLDLPGVDGFQVARLIRQREALGAHLPIIAVTARSGSDEESNAREMGMDGFLRKPLTGEQLVNALRIVRVVGEPVN